MSTKSKAEAQTRIRFNKATAAAEFDMDSDWIRRNEAPDYRPPLVKALLPLATKFEGEGDE